MAGAGVLITDPSGARVLDFTIPGGAFDAATGVGWKAAPGRWTWVQRGSTPSPSGITGVALRDRSRTAPGLVQFKVKGTRGGWPVDPARLPLAGLLVLDPPTAETGQCGRAAFRGPAPACTAGPKAIRCR